MKKLLVGFTMVLALVLVANVAFTDETVPFPFWQHGWNIMSFWSVSNTADGAPATVTIEMLTTTGAAHWSTTGTVNPNTSWQVSTGDSYYTGGDGAGFGLYKIGASTDTIYLWGAVFAVLADSSPGYTVILPQNPYGVVAP